MSEPLLYKKMLILSVSYSLQKSQHARSQVNKKRTTFQKSESEI